MAEEPDEGISFPVFCAFAGIASVAILPRYAGQHWGWLDYAALTFFFFFLWWCLKPLRRSGLVSANPHEEARKSLAFRLGKSLNKVRRGLRV